MIPLGIFGVAFPQWLVFVGNDMAGAYFILLSTCLFFHKSALKGSLHSFIITRNCAWNLCLHLIGMRRKVFLNSTQCFFDIVHGFLGFRPAVVPFIARVT